MLGNYLLVLIRNLRRRFLLASINLGGLVVGMVSCILMSLRREICIIMQIWL